MSIQFAQVGDWHRAKYKTLIRRNLDGKKFQLVMQLKITLLGVYCEKHEKTCLNKLSPLLQFKCVFTHYFNTVIKRQL